jgi:hypothetical protein
LSLARIVPMLGVAATGIAGKLRVIYRSIDTADSGIWFPLDIDLPNVVMPSGKPVHVNYLLPHGYDPKQSYPLLIWLHADHQADDWYLNINPDVLYLAFYDADGYYNTTAFRTAYSCICMVIYADQTSSGLSADTAVANWGGGTNNGQIGSSSVFSGDTGPNTFAVLGMVDWALENWATNPSQIYVTGFDIGATGAAYLMLKYNQVNGNPRVFAAATAIGGSPTVRSTGLTAAEVAIMTEVPVWWVSGAADTVCLPTLWNEPMWQELAGTSAYPLPGSSATASSAGASLYHYWEDPSIGHQQVDSAGNAYPLNQVILEWLFSQIGSVTTVQPRLWPTPVPLPTPISVEALPLPAFRSVRSSKSIDTGLVYFEVTADVISEHFTVGLATANYNLAEPMGPGHSTKYIVPRPALVDSVGYQPGSQFDPCRIYLDDGSYSESGLVSFCRGPGDVNGAVINVAIDLMTTPGVPTIWFSSPAMRAAGFAWNNDSIDNQNPVGSIGGIALRNLAAGPYFAIFATKEAGAVATFNFGAAGFAEIPPIPYQSWDTFATVYTPPITSLSPPLNLTAGVSTATTVPLQWAGPAVGLGPFVYDVQMWIAGQAVNLWRTIGSTGDIYFLVTGLLPGTHPRFRVNANNALGAGPWCRDLAFPTQSTDGRTIAPLDMHLIQTTTTAITLQWAPAIGPAMLMSYQLAYAPYQSDHPNWNDLETFIALEIVPFTTVSLTIPDLQANQAYWVVAQVLVNGTPAATGLSYNVFTTLPLASQGGGETLLIPPGAEQISFNGDPYVIQPIGVVPGFAVYADVNAPMISAETMAAVLADCDSIYHQLALYFGAAAVAQPSIETIANPTGQLAVVILGGNQQFVSTRLAAADIDFYLSAAASDTTNADVYDYLLAAQYAGVFMTGLSGFASQPVWPDACTLGAALGQSMAYELYPNAVLGGATVSGQVASYLNSARANWLTSLSVTDGSVAVGCNILFITYLVHQLNYSYLEITSAIDRLSSPITAATLYAALTATSVDPYVAFSSVVHAAFAAVVPANFTYNPWPIELPLPASLPNLLTATTVLRINVQSSP